MYINDVIDRVEQLKPSEYNVSEMYMWCDEVSSMLTVEDRRCYKSIRLRTAPDGSLLLPENVNIEHVVFIKYGKEIIHKCDLRSCGYGRIFRPETPFKSLPNTLTEVCYLAPYEPIRLVKYKGEITIDADNDTIVMSDCEFVPGDTLIIEINGVVSGSVPLLDVDFADNDDTRRSFVLTVGEGSLDGLSENHSDTAVVRRIITETTVCDAPYDSMYVDYIHAKIALYQGDTSDYNQFMASFNSKLSSYKSWLSELMPKVKREFHGWW